MDRTEWRIPAGLIALSAIPALAGALRVVGLAIGVPVTPDNERFFASPVPVVLHIVGATTFCLVGAFQFVPSIRRRHRDWHRRTGRVLAVCGLVAAFSGLWMTGAYDLPAHDGLLLNSFRVVFGGGMALSIVLGVVAVRRGDIAAHRAWMTRGYAIGLGAGTQAVTQLPWILAVGQPNTLSRALLMAAGWIINLVVAEWVIRRPVLRRKLVVT